jgi:hypothetical protein
MSSKRTIGLSFGGLASAAQCFTYLTKCSFIIYPDRWNVCWMCQLYVQSQCWWGAFYMSLSYMLQYITRIRKGIWKSFTMLLVNFPCFCTALTACSNASPTVLHSHKSSWKVPTHLFSKTGTTCLGTHLVDLLWNYNTPWIWQLNHVCSTCQPLLSP